MFLLDRVLVVSGLGFGSSRLGIWTSEGLLGLSCHGLGFSVFDSLEGFWATRAFRDTVFPPFATDCCHQHLSCT